MIGEKLENNCTAALLMFENLWAVNFVKAVENANGRSVMHVRIPHEVVVETMEKIAAGEAKPALEESATTDTQSEAAA
jgi:flagellar motor switch protein FliM